MTTGAITRRAARAVVLVGLAVTTGVLPVACGPTKSTPTPDLSGCLETNHGLGCDALGATTGPIRFPAAPPRIRDDEEHHGRHRRHHEELRTPTCTRHVEVRIGGVCIL